MTDPIDMAVVDELIELSDGGDPDLLVDLIEMYLQDGPHKLAEIDAGLAKQDWGRVERAAHSLKGAAGNLGAMMVFGDCDTVEEASKAHELETVQRSATELREHFAEAEVALKDLLAKYS